MKGAGKIRAIGCCLILSMALVLWTFDYAAAPVKYRLGTGDAIDFTAVTKSNQGAGSGLDADTVDGRHASDLVTSGVGGIKDTDIDWGLNSGQVNTDDIPEGTGNKYFSGKTTANLPEGSNLYYTGARFDTRLATKTTDNLPEGTTNKYNHFGVAIDSSEITDGTIVNADVSATAAVTESKLSLNYATHSNANDPTADEKAALAGTSGTPTAVNKYVTNSDSRLSDARTPTAHASGHASGGADALSGNLDSVAKTTVRKNTGADTGSRRRLNFIEGSNVTLTVADDPTGEEVDVTIASSGGGGTIPCFSVHKNGTNQIVSDSTWTKLTWSTEEFDTNNNFDTDKFTPTVAGKYSISAGAEFLSLGDGQSVKVAIYKNGTIYRGSHNTHGAGSQPLAAVIPVIVDMNGSTDYVEAYVYQSGGGASKDVNGSTNWTFFQGCKID